MKRSLASFVVSSLAVSALAAPDPYQTKVFTRGAELHGANGMAFGPDGLLHVVSGFGLEIVGVSPRSGRIIERAAVDAADDVAFGPDGSMYWTEVLSGEVGVLRPDGTAGTIAILNTALNAIAFSPDGRLFVSALPFADQLYELDPWGVAPPRLVTENNLFGLNAFAFGDDGFIYGPRWFAGEVARIDPDTGEVTVLMGGFGAPLAVRFDSMGRMHVLDQVRQQILRIDPDTGTQVVVATVGPNLDNFVFDDCDRLFVSSAQDGFVVEVLPNGKLRGVLEGGLIVPGAMTYVHGNPGTLLVADQWALREISTRTGKLIDSHSHVFGDPTSVLAPVTVGPAGANVVLTSWLLGEVQIYDPHTRTVVSNHHGFMAPLNAVGFAGDVVVAELAVGGLVRLSDRSVFAAGFAYPIGLAADQSALYVSDLALGAVFRVSVSGVVTPIANGLLAPEGIALDHEGGLLVVETAAKRLTRIDLASGVAKVVAKDLAVGLQGSASAPPSWLAVSTPVVDPSGTVYLTGDVDNVIYRLRPR